VTSERHRWATIYLVEDAEFTVACQIDVRGFSSLNQNTIHGWTPGRVGGNPTGYGHEGLDESSPAMRRLPIAMNRLLV
jgi:hypothetical protein